MDFGRFCGRNPQILGGANLESAKTTKSKVFGQKSVDFWVRILKTIKSAKICGFWAILGQKTDKQQSPQNLQYWMRDGPVVWQESSNCKER